MGAVCKLIAAESNPRMYVSRNVINRIAANCGYVSVESAKQALEELRQRLHHAQASESTLHAQLQSQAAALGASQRQVAALQLSLASMNSAWDLQAWLDVALAVFPDRPDVPIEFRQRTQVAAAKAFPKITSLADLAKPGLYEGKEDARTLYWAIAHAGVAAQTVARNLKSEDSISGSFLDALKAQISQRNVARDAGSLSIGIATIYDNVKPALKESRVGADMLLIITGDTLLPGGGARLFWIQAKRGGDGAPLTMNVHRDQNGTGKTQYEALRAVHQPKQGSFSVYALYAPGYPFVSGTIVNAFDLADSRDRAQCWVDLSKVGFRFQEVLLWAARSGSASERFDSVESVLAFLESATAQSIVPISVVSIHAGARGLDKRLLTQRIKGHYDRALLEHHYAQDHKRDRGPAFSR